MATGSKDGTVRVWSLAGGEWAVGHRRAGSPPRQKGAIRSAALAGGFPHAIELCRFEPGELDDFIPGLRMKDYESFIR